jgi:uncharacterized membrane protein YvbJ
MVLCNECGIPISDEAKACKECGTTLKDRTHGAFVMNSNVGTVNIGNRSMMVSPRIGFGTQLRIVMTQRNFASI